MAVIGSVIDGKYEILKLIGKGGMSEVYLAMDKNLNKQWAVKEIKRQARNRNNEVIVQSAIAEANMMKKLDHPCLPRIVDIINRDDVIYVVMDYIEGEPLNKVLDKYGAQAQDIVIEWAEDLCGVLDYLHAQNPPIIYRDMKPANIMLQPSGNIKLIDFGIAREYKEQNLEDTVSLGTKGYAAPEQFGGKGQTDRRTDIYCLGVTLYHLLTGKNPCEPPYEIYPIRYWKPELSAGLENIILKCTQLNPSDRFDSCAELMYALRHYEEADDAYRKKQKRKVSYFMVSVAMSVVFLIVGILGQFMSNLEDKNSYEAYMLQADTASGPEEQMENYIKAIEIKPTSLEAYYGLIRAYKDDAVFSIEEEAQFKSVINANLSELREDPEYAKLAYEIGKLYWYYYDYGKTEVTDNQITRMKSAIQWFEDANHYGIVDSEYYVMAEIYKEIGEFHRDVTLNVEEASDAGTYWPYYSNLKELFEIAKQEENEMICLEVYKLCINSLENYVRKFRIDGVGQEELELFYADVLAATKATVTTTDKTESIRNDILSREEYVNLAIESAYAK